MQYLETAGFENIEFINKKNSNEIIKNWNFGEGVENAVFSAYIKAIKPLS